MAATTAFALAGLGGFNAHGAGFLHAASRCKIVPDLVTATSGQIVVLADWLQGKDLEQALVDTSLETNPLAQLAVAVAGAPGVFRPAYWETLQRWFTPPPFGEKPLEALLDRLLPAQVYVPTRDPAVFETIADTLNNHATIDDEKVGVVFNAYDLKSGQAVLFGNKKARKLWPSRKAVPKATYGSFDKSAGEPVLLQPIDADAVRSALWLSLYGFDQLPEGSLIDGAYHRACIVAELHEFDRVFVARPLAQGWHGRRPGNWFEMQDWQTEMWFSVGYKAEVDALRTINGLVADGRLGKPFKEVDLIEVAPRTPAGFSNYFIERDAIFHRAYDDAMAAFQARR